MWENGGIYGGNGTLNNDSTTRIRSKIYIPFTNRVKPLPGYKIAVFAYSGGSYVGGWDGSSFQTVYTWFTDEIDISSISKAYDIKLVGGLTSDADMTVSSAGNFLFGITDAAARFNELIVNVKDFGAKGDGTTEDTASIKRAVAMTPSGSVLYFPEGTYVVDDISLKSNMIVRGDGFGSIIKLKANASCSPYSNCLTCRNVSNVRIERLCLDGNRLNNSTSGDSVQDQNHNGVFVTGCKNVTIDGVLAKSNGFHGCIMTNNENVNIFNSEFTDNGFRPFHAHAKLHGGRFLNNYCHDNGKGFPNRPTHFDGILFFHDIRDVLISGNTVKTSNYVGAIIIGGKGGENEGSDNIVISDNVISSGVPWENGGVYGGNGELNNSATNRIRTKSYIPITNTVHVASGYKVGVVAYSNGSYVGIWDGVNFNTYYTWLTEDVDISGISGSYDIKLVGGLSTDADLTSSEADNFLLDSHGIVLIGADLDNVCITGNAIANCNVGIFADSAYAVGKGIVISNNIIKKCVRGFSFAGAVNQCNITDNAIQYCQKEGVYIAKMQNGVLKGNLLTDNGGASQTYDGIKINNSHELVVTGNSVVNTDENKYQNYGIREDGTCDSNIFVFNVMKKTKKTSILVVGANSVAKDNMFDGVLST